MTKVHEDLAEAEAILEKALGKINNIKDGRMPNGKLWIGKFTEFKRLVSVYLKLKALRKKLEYFDV